MSKVSFATSYNRERPEDGFVVWALELYADGRSVTAYPFRDAAGAANATFTHGLPGVFTEDTCRFFEQLASDEYVWDTDMDRTDDGFTYLTWIELNS